MRASRGMGAIRKDKTPGKKTMRRKDGAMFDDNGQTKRRKDGDMFTMYGSDAVAPIESMRGVTK